MQCLFYQLQITVHQKSRFSGDRILTQTLRSVEKRYLKHGGQIVCLIFLYGNSGDSDRIFSDVLFAYNEKRNSTYHYR